MATDRPLDAPASWETTAFSAVEDVADKIRVIEVSWDVHLLSSGCTIRVSNRNMHEADKRRTFEQLATYRERFDEALERWTSVDFAT